MSDVIDLRLLGSMVSRLQSTVEDVRQEYAGIRASLDALTTATISRHSEFNMRLSSLELGQMKLAAAFDRNQDRLDRIDVEVHDLKADVRGLKSDVHELKADVHALKVDVQGLKADVHALKADVGEWRADLQELNGGVRTVNAEVRELTVGLGDVRTDVHELKAGLHDVQGRAEETNRKLDLILARLGPR